jgi:hypothetical protein
LFKKKCTVVFSREAGLKDRKIIAFPDRARPRIGGTRTTTRVSVKIRRTRGTKDISEEKFRIVNFHAAVRRTGSEPVDNVANLRL